MKLLNVDVLKMPYYIVVNYGDRVDSLLLSLANSCIIFRCKLICCLRVGCQAFFLLFLLSLLSCNKVSGDIF